MLKTEVKGDESGSDALPSRSSAADVVLYHLSVSVSV